MDENSQALIIAFGILSSGALFCWFFNHYKEINTARLRNRVDNVRKNSIFKTKIKPIIEITCEEVKDEFKQHEIRIPQTLVENV